jgi:hypothetical protein
VLCVPPPRSAPGPRPTRRAPLPYAQTPNVTESNGLDPAGRSREQPGAAGRCRTWWRGSWPSAAPTERPSSHACEHRALCPVPCALCPVPCALCCAACCVLCDVPGRCPVLCAVLCAQLCHACALLSCKPFVSYLTLLLLMCVQCMHCILCAAPVDCELWTVNCGLWILDCMQYSSYDSRNTMSPLITCCVRHQARTSLVCLPCLHCIQANVWFGQRFQMCRCTLLISTCGTSHVHMNEVLANGVQVGLICW